MRSLSSAASFALAALTALAGCAPASPPQAAPRPVAAAPVVAPAAPAPRFYPHDTLRSGEGPVPGSAWEKGRPFWLEGELVPKSFGAREDSAEDATLTSERQRFLRTRAVATADRFAWGSHVCTAPSYEQRVVDEETRRLEHNRPPSSRVADVLYWEVRVTCAPGKGDGELRLSRVIEHPGVLEHWFSGFGGPFFMRFQAFREIPPPLADPEPGKRLANGEGPLPASTWEEGRPAWFDGVLAPGRVLFKGDEAQGKAREHERQALTSETLVVSATRVAYAGHVCKAPRFDQRLMTHRDWLDEQHTGGLTTGGAYVWLVRVQCAKADGDLSLELKRFIFEGKPADGMSGTFDGFTVTFDFAKKK